MNWCSGPQLGLRPPRRPLDGRVRCGTHCCGCRGIRSPRRRTCASLGRSPSTVDSCLSTRHSARRKSVAVSPPTDQPCSAVAECETRCAAHEPGPTFQMSRRLTCAAAVCFCSAAFAQLQLHVDKTERVEARRGDRLCFELLGLVQGFH